MLVADKRLECLGHQPFASAKAKQPSFYLETTTPPVSPHCKGAILELEM